MSLFSLSGGVLYHLKALRYGPGLWAPFRLHVARWLEQVLPPTERLVLVGPSAGHCLPLAHLARFPELCVLEPDPLARYWLRQRLPRARIVWESRDLLVAPLLTDRPGLDAVLARRPGAAVLFCDLLGQVQLELFEPQQRRFQDAFRQRILPALEGRRWASFHDRWSLDRAADAPPVPDALELDHVPSDQELGAALFGAAGPDVTVLDHGASELFPEPGPRRYFAWQISPGALHIVEAVSG